MKRSAQFSCPDTGSTACLASLPFNAPTGPVILSGNPPAGLPAVFIAQQAARIRRKAKRAAAAAGCNCLLAIFHSSK